MDEQARKGAEALYERWLDAWRRVDGEEMKSFWDQNYASPIYLAEEIPDPLSSWPAIDEYWTVTPTLIEAIPEARDVSHTLCDMGNVIMLFAKVFIDLRIKGGSKPLAGELRMSFAMHEVDGEMKLIHYHESRQVDLAPYLA